MCAEFLRLTTVNVVDSMISLLETYATRLVDLSKESTRAKVDLLNLALAAITSANSTEEQRRGLMPSGFCFSCIFFAFYCLGWIPTFNWNVLFEIQQLCCF